MSERCESTSPIEKFDEGPRRCTLPSGHSGRHRALTSGGRHVGAPSDYEVTWGDARLASEDARERLCERPSDCLHPSCQCGPALPFPSGPDAETLAAKLERVEALDECSMWKLAADEWHARFEAAVALVEQLREAHGIQLHANAALLLLNAKHIEKVEQREREVARYRQALKDTGRIAISVGLGAPTRYIEIAKIARDALAASVPGTEEPA